jgi:dephospho-CoA kinase
MKNWIVTGGVGCGKSAVLHLLQRQAGVASFSCDDEVRRLLDTMPVLAALEREFGPGVVKEGAEGRRADRAWLRSRVFAREGERARLESLLHPAVLAALESARSQAREAGCNLFLAEVPLHYEIGATVSADLVLVVASSRVVQVRRLMESRGLDEPIIEKMLRAQWPIEAKVDRADVVIWNDGCRDALEAQVLTLARQLRQA